MSKGRSRTANARTPSRPVHWLGVSGGIGILVLAAFLFAQPYRTPSQATADAQVVRISMGGWQPGTVEAQSGENVTLTMVNLDSQYHTDGGGWHNFVVPDLDVEFRVPPKGTESFTFTVAVEPGEYLFYCDICCGGKDNPFMQGTLSVT